MVDGHIDVNKDLGFKAKAGLGFQSLGRTWVSKPRQDLGFKA